MSRFNPYINSHFSACRVLARAFDDCRNRQVTIHQVPGYWDVVGVTDGTDAWIAPASTGPFFRTATGDVADILRRLQAGEDPGPAPDAPKPRKKILAISPAPTEASQPIAPRRTRRAITQA